LQDSLNTIWEVQPKPGLGIVQMIIDRFFAFAMVLVIWFLMLISLVTSAAMAAAVRVASPYVVGIQFIESLLSLTLITAIVRPLATAVRCA
jgi:membrane protein